MLDPADTATPAATADRDPVANDLFITEIMWALNTTNVVSDAAKGHWAALTQVSYANHKGTLGKLDVGRYKNLFVITRTDSAGDPDHPFGKISLRNPVSSTATRSKMSPSTVKSPSWRPRI